MLLFARHVALSALICGALGSGGCDGQARAVQAEGRGSEPVREVMTASAQQALTPDAVLADLEEGNRRFAAGEPVTRDLRAQARATESGQYPKAAILGCIDSRVPPEVVFDQGIGDLFVARVAGNIENVDLLGSLEFATAVAGAKLVVVLGHTGCGAIEGAAAGVELGHLTALLDNFEAPLQKARAGAEAGGGDGDALVGAATEYNVRQTMEDIRARSAVIRGLVERGDVAIVGGVYDLESGRVRWLEP